MRCLKLAAFLRERYFCTFYDAIKVILPAGVWMKSERRYRISPDAPTERHLEVPLEELLQLIRDLGGNVEESQLLRQIGTKRRTDLQLLVKRGYLKTSRELLNQAADKLESVYHLGITPEEALALAEKRARRAPVQAAVRSCSPMWKALPRRSLPPWLVRRRRRFAASQSEGLVERSQREVLRDGAFLGREEPLPVLNREQQAALDGLLRQAKNEKPGVALLYGVTGSGKTSVYLKLIEACLATGARRHVDGA